MLIFLGVGHAQDDAFQVRLDRTMKQVAAYAVVGDLVTPIALEELANSTHGQPGQRRLLAQRLARLLTSNAPNAAKTLACRQLSLLGTADEVPALAPLLVDEKLAHLARLALERIPGPAADQALREALPKTEGKLLVGVIRSLGTRRDSLAVEPLVKTLRGSDAEVAAAAAKSLALIGGPAATQALCAALTATKGPLRIAVADACLAAADTLGVQGKRNEAIALYDHLREANVARPMRRAATRGAILARRSAGVPLLVEQLRGKDPDLFALGLSLVREMPEAEVPKAAAVQLASLAPQAQVRLIEALADRGDKAAAPAVLAVAETGEIAARAAALQALARLGDAKLVPMLVPLACDGPPQLVEPATTALAAMPGQAVDVALLSRVTDPDAKTRRVVITILGQRRPAAAVDVLFQAAADAEPAVRLAAIKALGNTVKPAQMGPLAELLLKAPGSTERTAVEEAIASAAAGMSNKDGCAERLVALLPKADAEGRTAVLRTLSQVGGSKALAAVRAAVSDANREIQDAAVRALSNWATAEAAEPLAGIARESSDRKHKILALRGYIRLIGLAEESPQEKLRRANLAFAMSERDDERRLALGAMGNIGSHEALDRLLVFLDRPAVKNEAAAAAIANGYKLVRTNPAAVAQAMRRVAGAVDNPGLKRRAQELLGRCQ
jgi:HEAT repeat protein